MSVWNYVVTAHKPTNVTHSCFGNFTAPDEDNLIIAKCTRIEILQVTPLGSLEPVLDVPIYGRITALKLFRPHGEAQDFLFIATEKYKFRVLQWDVETRALITKTSDTVHVSNTSLEFFSPPLGSRPTDRQIVIIDPDCRLIGLHLFDGRFEVILFDNKWQLGEKGDVEFDVRLEEFQVLDIKFLYGRSKPTIAVLYQDDRDARHVKTYEVAVKDKYFDIGPWTKDINIVGGPWSEYHLSIGAELLIPVPQPLCGVLIIGGGKIVHCGTGEFVERKIQPSIIRAYGRLDADGSRYRYLLGDHAGLLHLLVITHEKEKVTGIESELLGKTSIASTISYLGNALVYIGSSYGDSQLVKLNLQPDAKCSSVEVLETYVNLGPIVDFCVVDPEREGQGQVVTCSGAYKDGRLSVVLNGIGINEQASIELQGIVVGMWSLRSSTDDPHDFFLVVSFISETRIWEMNTKDEKDELGETEIEGFSSQVQTLFCHDALFNQLVQVTSSSVRLVSSTSRDLKDEWFAPAGYLINVATANATQVLLATGGKRLVYLEIDDGLLIEKKHVQLDFEISCLDINPIGENPNYSQLAAVGMWTDISVQIYSLPDLNRIKEEHLEGEIMPRSVLLCSFEGISYLLCALGDGHLLNFTLNTTTGELTDRKKVSLGTQPITLRTFSSKSTTRVFAASDRPTVIYSSNKKLLYSAVNLKEVSHMCPFNPAIPKTGKLTIGTIDHIQKLHIRTIPLGERVYARRICHQEKSRTFAICSVKNNQTGQKEEKKTGAEDSETHFIRLLDDQSFGVVTDYQLDAFECACSILSCSFSDDSNVYYCVGTSYVPPGQNEPTKGRILVFFVEDGRKLQLIAEQATTGSVYSLNAFNGKLLAAINQTIQLYKWTLRDDGTRELQSECGHHVHTPALYVQTRGDFIVVGDSVKSISLLIYKHEEGAIEERAQDCYASSISAVEILDGDVYLGAENFYNLFTVRENSEGATKKERGCLEDFGAFDFGEVVNRFRHQGSPHVYLGAENFHNIVAVRTKKERGCLEVVGSYHLGEVVNRFRRGSLVMRLPDSDVGQIPTVIFGTVNGVIGVIASLPQDQYSFLEKLQTNLRKVIKGVGGLSHEEWRVFNGESHQQWRNEEKREALWRKKKPWWMNEEKEEASDAKNFLDGDLIESFLDLSHEKKDEISKQMSVPVEDLCKRVEELTRSLH